MKKLISYISVSAVLCAGILEGPAQNADSLLRVLRQQHDDTSRIKILVELGDAVHERNPDSAQLCAADALKRAERLKFYRGEIRALNLLARISKNKGDMDRAIELNRRAYALCHSARLEGELDRVYTGLIENYRLVGKYDSAQKYCEMAIAHFERIGNINYLSLACNGMGIIMRRKGNLSKALEYFQKSARLLEGRNRESSRLMTEMNIGLIYDDMGDHKKARNLFRSIAAKQRAIKDYRNLVSTLANLGSVFTDLEQPDSALVVYDEVLRVADQLRSDRVKSQAYNNMATAYIELGRLDKGVEYFRKSLELKRKLNDLPGMANTLSNLGEIYGEKKEYAAALSNFAQALDYARQSGDMMVTARCYMNLSLTYELMGDYKNAFENYKIYKDYNDSIFNNENNRVLREMQAKYDTEAKEKENRLLQEKNSFNEEKIRQQNIRFLIMGAFLLVVAALSFFLFRSNAEKRKANQLLRRQKEEINSQKEMVTAKNKEITDSIRYAEKIQQAILPAEHKFGSLFSDYFLFYSPRDIVSGDFYWVHENERYIFWAAADCTGHGVPGGFMTMLGISFLEETVSEMMITDTNGILDKLSERLVSALRQKEAAAETKDGMDMVLCRLSKDQGRLCWSAANNGFYTARNKILSEHKPDKQPVGFYGADAKPFAMHETEVMPGDMIYTFTDGYADQFGGPKGKKFKYKQLEGLLAHAADRSGKEQRALISRTFEEWKGNYEQIDDVLVIGIRI